MNHPQLSSPQRIILSEIPQVIFFDAMGTLFDLHHGVGEIYRQHALKHGVDADADNLERAFRSSFASAPPLAFPDAESKAIAQQEFTWWKQVVKATFTELEAIDKFSDFTDFFTEVYAYFSTAEPWYVFEDTIESLTQWRKKGVELGVISNFDSRLIRVLNSLHLSEFFTTITISSSAGSAKPERQIFELALSKHGVASNRAWHIGDSEIADYQGAKNAGINSFWLNRQGRSLNIINQLPNLSSLG